MAAEAGHRPVGVLVGEEAVWIVFCSCSSVAGGVTSRDVTSRASVCVSEFKPVSVFVD